MGCPSEMRSILVWACVVAARRPPTTVPLIILKNPRSGSSWLVQLLNAMPSAFVTEEILTSKSAGHGDVVGGGTAHLARALVEPMGRFGRGAAFDPETGVGVDRATRELGKKNRGAWDVLGFTVSPKRVLGLDLFARPDGVFWRVPRTRVVLYERASLAVPRRSRRERPRAPQVRTR